MVNRMNKINNICHRKVEKDESIFFHKKNIRALSHLIEQCQMNKNNKKIYVAFEIRIGKDSGIYTFYTNLLPINFPIADAIISPLVHPLESPRQYNP